MAIPSKPSFCPNCHSTLVIRKGVRRNQHRTIPIYRCKSCYKYFSAASIARVKYPPHIIVKALTYYNLGHSQSSVAAILAQKHRLKVPRRTISLWCQRYHRVCTFTRLRAWAMKRYSPKDMILARTFQHGQVYTYKLHRAKLDLLKTTLAHADDYQRLCGYLQTISGADFPHHLFAQDESQSDKFTFTQSLRSSQLNLALLPTIKTRKENLANDLATLGLILAKTNRERHEQIQEFMLVNDSSTIACEVPVYLTAKDIGYYKKAGFHLPLRANDAPITGHIDLVQVRQGHIHILDYKPDAKRIQPVSQLTLYALALASHTRLPLKLFKCAWFDEKDYFEFYPLHCVFPKYSLGR